jgi:predicted amino acid racemase
MSDFYQDAILLKAEIIEIKTKDSYPVGKLSIDAFGNKPTYTDSGKRKRALLALGKKDIGSHEKLIVIEPGIKIIGSSSDHLIVDIDEAEKKYNVGDIMSFRLYYPAMLYSSQSPDVEKKFINLPKKR